MVTDLLGNQDDLDLAAVEDRDLSALLPESKKRAYDVHPLVDGVLDEGSMQELHERWAPNIVTALGRLGGRSVGVVANNPLRLGGCLDSLSAEKASRFVRLCDALGIPLVVLVDVPGYLPGVGSGVGRRRPARGQAAARVRRVRRAPGHPDHPQDLRRRLHRDELPRARRHQGLRVGGRRGGGDGAGGRDPHPPPAQAGRGRRPRSVPRSRPSWQPSTSGWPAGSRRRARSASSTRWSSPTRTRIALAQAIHDAVQRDGVRRGQHGNIPL